MRARKTGQRKVSTTMSDEAPRLGSSESPLGWLRRRKDKSGEAMITAEQFDAGERLARDFLLGALQPRTTMSWSPVASSSRGSGGGGAVDMSDAIVAAKTRVNRALAAVGPELSGILVDVCCYNQGLEDCERQGGLPARSAKTVLQMALTSLARHYGLLPPEAPPLYQGGRVRHWGAEDYRPRMDPVRSNSRTHEGQR